MPDASVGVSKNIEWEEKPEWKLNYLDEWGVEDNGNLEEKHEESKQNRNCLKIINVSSEQSLRLANCHEASHLRTMICIEDHQG